MLRTDSPARRDMVTDMAIAMILENGLGAVTVRGVAAKIGIAAPTLLGWYGTAERVRFIVGQTYCARWVQWIQRRAFRDGPFALLPLTEDEVGWTRVWEAILELGRLDEDVALCIEDAVAFERHLAGQTVVADIDEVMALIDGLRQAVTRMRSPMSPCPGTRDPGRAPRPSRRGLAHSELTLVRSRRSVVAAGSGAPLGFRP